MEFKEFSEYTNPESMDYDIKTNHESYNNIYIKQLISLVGILDDINEADLLKNYGITLQEYLNPTKEVINKIKKHLENGHSKGK